MIKAVAKKEKNRWKKSEVAGLSMRPATESDHPFLLKLFGSTRERELSMVPQWSSEQKGQFVYTQWHAQLSHYQEHYPVATHHILGVKVGKEMTPAGRLYVDRGETNIQLMDIAFLPAFRNRGLGTAIIQSLVDEAAVTQKTVGLYVFKENDSAIKLYDRLGFTNLGEAAGLYIKMAWRPVHAVA